MNTEQIPAFLADPRMLELLDIARTIEVSLLQEMNADGCTVTAFFQHAADRREILATKTGPDMFETTKAAVEAAFEHIYADIEARGDA